MGRKTNLKVVLVLAVFLIDSCGLLRAAMAKGSQAAETKDKQKAGVQLPAGAGGNWWSAVQKEIRQSEYKIIRQEETSLPDVKAAYQAPNRAQNLRTYFTPTGIQVVRRTESVPGWQWSLHLTGYGYAGEVKAVDEAKLVVSENRIEYRRGGVIEWYVNDEKGLEQGFTLAGPPESNGGKTKSEIVLEMAVAGELEGRMSKDGNIVTFISGEGEEVLNYGGLVAKDAAGRELESQISLNESRITLNIDVNGAQYPVIIDPVITGLPMTADWMAEGDSLYAMFGYSVATAGDVNGDGYDDIIVGAPYYDGGQLYEGKAFVYHGSAIGLSYEANWTAESNVELAMFGYSVSTAGDINGDGSDDVIVGAPFFFNGQINEGVAFVYHGSSSGLSSGPARLLEMDQADSMFGNSVSTAGDVNGDGYDDVIVGAYLYDNGQIDEGAAFVYHGSAAGLSGVPAWIMDSDQESAYFGFPVATAGDVNGDGYDDVIIGAPLYAGDRGAAFVYHGSATGLSFEAAWTADGESYGDLFGYSVATAGDVNGDGFSDVIVGAPQDSNDQSWEGSAFVYHGSTAGLSTSPDWTAEGNQTEAFFGVSVSTAGDVSGNGYSDVIVGAFGFSNDQMYEGAAFLYRGSAFGLSVEPVWSAEGGQADAEFGWSVATAGDVNGDGFSDVIVGAPQYSNGQMWEGAAFVYHGMCWLKADLTGDCDVDFFDFSMLVNYWMAPSSVVDLTGDGVIDYFDLRVLTRQWLAENTPPPAQASSPNPPDGGGISNLNPDLSWTAGPYAESHDVYFGTSSPPPFIRNQTDTTFDPGTLTLGTQYYWRIDEVGTYETTMGLLWSFSIMTGPPP